MNKGYERERERKRENHLVTHERISSQCSHDEISEDQIPCNYIVNNQKQLISLLEKMNVVS